MLQKHLMITAALLATLGLTACNKDKTTVGPTPQEQKAPNVGADLESDLPQLGDTKTSVPVSSDTPITSTPVSQDYNPANVNNIDSVAYGKGATGGVSKEGLIYTTTSTDNTLDVIRGLQRDYVVAAPAVTWAVLSFDSVTGQSVVTLKLSENGFEKTYNLSGVDAQDQDNQVVTIRATARGNGTKTTGKTPIRGTLQCLDLDGGCETTLVKAQMGYPGSSAQKLDIVFRQSIADIHFNMPKQASNNPEYAYIKEMVTNSTSRTSESQNRVKTSRMHSWEVPNGRAGFSVAFRTYTDELVGFSGPLVSQYDGNTTDVQLTRLKRDLLDNGDDMIGDSVQLNYQNSIGTARLIANNGLGQLRLAIKMRKRSNYKQDVFSVTFMRRIKPVAELEQLPEGHEVPPPAPTPAPWNPGSGSNSDGGESDLPSVE